MEQNIDASYSTSIQKQGVEDDLIPASEMKNIFPGTTDQTWNGLRPFGGGPKYVKVARKVYYRRADVQEWIDSNVHTRTDRPVV